MFKYRFTERVAAQVELNYMKKGYKWGSSTFGKVRENWHYLNLPILIQYSLKAPIQFELGIEPSYLFGFNKTFFEDPEVIEVFDLGGLFGISYMIKGQYEITARYFHSFIPYGKLYFYDFVGAGGVIKEEVGLTNHYHTYLKISVGYFFNRFVSESQQPNF